MDDSTADMNALLESMGMAIDPNGDFVWSTDMGQNFDPVNANTLIDEQARYYQDGNFAQVPMAQQTANIQTAFGNPHTYASSSHTLNPGFPSSDFHLYQSSDSLAPSTTSASSGFNINRKNPRWNVDDEAQRFRNENPLLVTPAPPVTTPNQNDILDSNGDLDEDAFKRHYPNFGKLLFDFVIMTILLLYYDETLRSWPSSDILLRLANQAIDIILQCNATDTLNIAETLQIPGTTTAIAKWVTLQVRNHLEDILLVARSSATGFGLSDYNDGETNKRNFRAATFLSAYLHRLYIPQFVGDLPRIQYAYMNPVLLTVIREAFYASKTSIARQAYMLFLKYPSLKRDMRYMGFNWMGALPKNAFVIGAVAVRQALKEWEKGHFSMLTWGLSARSRFVRIGNAISTKVGNRAYYRRLSQEAGEKWYKELHLGHVPVVPSVPPPPPSDGGSDYDVPTGN